MRAYAVNERFAVVRARVSVLNEGYAAAPNKAGIAPLRAHTCYEAVDYQAGVPPL